MQCERRKDQSRQRQQTREFVADALMQQRLVMGDAVAQSVQPRDPVIDVVLPIGAGRKRVV